MEIIIYENNPKYDSRNDCNAVIETATNKLILGCKNTTVIPYGVEVIDDWSFVKTKITSIVISTSVTYINWGAFTDCFDLETVYYEGSQKQWKETNINNSLDCNSWLLDATLICTGKDDDGFIYEENGDGTSSVVGMATTIIIPDTSPNGETIIRIGSFIC